MQRYNCLYENLTKGVQSINGIWYHGDQNHRIGFVDQRMQNSNNMNAWGPGIYLTSDKNEAIGYAHPNGMGVHRKHNWKFCNRPEECYCQRDKKIHLNARSRST